MKRLKKILILMFLFIICSSCSHHISMLDKDPSYGSSFLIKSSQFVKIEYIDGKSNIKLRGSGVPRIELSPGKHVIQSSYYANSSFLGKVTIERSKSVLTEFNSLPGHLYFLKEGIYNINESEFYIPQIIDITEDVRLGNFDRHKLGTTFYDQNVKLGRTFYDQNDIKWFKKWIEEYANRK